jgi:hypothetical protein
MYMTRNIPNNIQIFKINRVSNKNIKSSAHDEEVQNYLKVVCYQRYF